MPLKDVEQSLQPDSAIVTVCATRYARLRTNRANDALPVKRMLERPAAQIKDRSSNSREKYFS